MARRTDRKEIERIRTIPVVEVMAMRYSLFPFASLKDAGGPDLVGQLRVRQSGAPLSGSRISNRDLLETVVDLLRDVPWDISVDHCEEDGGDLRLAVVAPRLGRDVEKGDRVQAGFFIQNSESGAFQTLAAERVYRVVCENGYMIECEQGQVATLAGVAEWRTVVAQVVERSFAAEGLDRDIARFRATTTQMLMTPYELLCNLVAQGVLSEEEQVAVQAEFDDVGDCTLYGLINAVTRIAGRCRDFDDWKRSVELERLGGEILRGDHQPPVWAPVYA
jgi:hypothetical protein